MTSVRTTAKKTSADEDRGQLQVTVIQDLLLLGINDPTRPDPKTVISKIDEHASEASTEHESEGGAKERKTNFSLFPVSTPLR